MQEPTIGDFELGPVLGQGGMAVVHRAVYRPTGEVVALKLMLTNVAEDPTYLERFRREARATAALQHENICRVIAWGESDGKMFMAMELIDGGSVRELKQKFAGRMPQQLAVDIVHQLLKALHAAHLQGVIHRDLKPANMMLTKSGKVKLVDFGIAKSTTDNTLTATGMLVGTPAFMSPEQVKGDPLDGRSDLFSAGLILHDLMVGRSPYYSDNPGTSLMKVLQEEVPDIFDILVGVDPRVEAAHTRLTAKKPEERFEDGNSAAAAFKPYLEEVRARYPRLIADCIENPAAMKKTLMREQAQAEYSRARRMLEQHGPLAAAALALENAIRLDPTFDEAHELFDTVSADVRYEPEPKDDPRITEAMAQLKEAPNHPGLLKRLADLHRANGNMRECARFLKRYLRIKDDTAALQQLVVLLHGPGGNPALVTGTLQRLSTRDIISGVKTGGMPAIRPDKPRETTSNLSRFDANQKAAIAQAAQARTASGQTGALRKNGLDFVTVAEARPDTGAPADITAFGRLREQLGLWGWVGVGGVVAVAIVAFAARGVIFGVEKAQKDIKSFDQRKEEKEEEVIDGFQQGWIFEANNHFTKKNMGGCVIAATRAMEGEKRANIILEATWLRAQCALMGRDTSTARADLDSYVRYATLRDPRRAVAENQLRAIEAGETPPAIR